MFCTDNTVLSCSEVSCSNNSFIILRAGSTGTVVNSAETSLEHRHYPGKRVTLLILLTKSLLLCIWWGDLPTNGLSILARTFATP